MEHPRAVVPVGEDPLVRPAIAHDVAQAEPHQLRQRRPLRRGHVGLPHVGAGIEDVVVGRRDVHVAAHDDLLRPCGDHLAQRGQPGELVRVVLRARLPPVRHVHGDHPDPGARRGDRPRLGVREARRAGESRHHVVESDAREDGDPVPRRLTVDGDGVPARGELLAEQLEERVVGSLVSCRHTTSGRRSSSHGSSRGTRCLTELTFQVASRTGHTVPARLGDGHGRRPFATALEGTGRSSSRSPAGAGRRSPTPSGSCGRRRALPGAGEGIGRRLVPERRRTPPSASPPGGPARARATPISDPPGRGGLRQVPGQVGARDVAAYFPKQDAAVEVPLS